MYLICENEEVLQRFVGENSFLDAAIERYVVGNDSEGVVVDVHFRMRPKSKWPKVLLRFSCCDHYAICGEGERHFYCVSHLKLFTTDVGKFYASFDPYNVDSVISEKDNDVIHAGRIRAYKV